MTPREQWRVRARAVLPGLSDEDIEAIVDALVRAGLEVTT